MSEPKDVALCYRDLLNGIVQTVHGDNQDAVVTRCAISIAVQELENWLYNGEMSPSVVPAKDVSGWEPTFMKMRESAVHEGQVSVEQALASLLTSKQKQLIRQGNKKEAAESLMIGLQSQDITVAALACGYWETHIMKTEESLTIAEMNLLKRSEKLQCIKAVRKRTGLGLKEAKDLVDKFTPITFVRGK